MKLAMLSDIHSFIGLIRQLNGEFKASQRAYVTAAWVAQRADKQEQLATSLYRLGASIGRTGAGGDPQKMTSTVKKANAVMLLDDATEDTELVQDLIG